MTKDNQHEYEYTRWTDAMRTSMRIAFEIPLRGVSLKRLTDEISSRLQKEHRFNKEPARMIAQLAAYARLFEGNEIKQDHFIGCTSSNEFAKNHGVTIQSGR